MVVFENKEPAKGEYRRFKIKTIDGADDVGMMAEVMERRVKRAIEDPDDWPLPELMIIDGGKGQVGKVKSILKKNDIEVPVIGIAKGFDRKQDRMVYDKHDAELQRIVKYGRNLFRQVRDEAHRFAVAYHKNVRKKKSFGES
jgi:excinuclease ABC subunit C